MKKERGSPQKVEHFLRCFPERSVRKKHIGVMIQGKRDDAFADTEQTRESKKRERGTWSVAEVGGWARWSKHAIGCWRRSYIREEECKN